MTRTKPPTKEGHGPLGVHLAIGKGYDAALAEARRLDISCCQLFTHNPRSWEFKTLDKRKVSSFTKALAALGISPIVSHCNYLINLGASNKTTRTKSVACLKKELQYAAAFNCDHLVLHVGKHTGAGLATGVQRVIAGINECGQELQASNVTLLLETVAGQGTEIGAEFSTLGEIINRVNKELQPLLGVCVDTCHVFAAGHDLRTKKDVEQLVQAMDEAFGIERVRFIHLNDSLQGLGEHRDRHVHIGEGHIGVKGFTAFLNHECIKPIPKVLETPDDGKTGDQENLARIKRLQA